MEMSNQQAADLGRAVVEMYQLKPIKNPNARNSDVILYDTDFGPKTVEGIGRCLVHVLAKNGYMMRDAESVTAPAPEEETRI